MGAVVALLRRDAELHLEVGTRVPEEAPDPAHDLAVVGVAAEEGVTHKAVAPVVVELEGVAEIAPERPAQRGATHGERATGGNASP